MSALAFPRRAIFLFLFSVSLFHTVFCQTGVAGYNYVLDTEYSGANFFNGWQFFTAGDPTNGFVQYVDQQTALSYDMINSSDTAPTYIGVDYTSKMKPGNNGAGRPSVRISTTKVWTHGLFIGDFAHAPGGICGTWPAWWTLGPNWPYTGEIDILEGVNLLTTNAMSLHTSPNYTIAGDPNTETGVLQATNCAYYQGGGNGVGCGVADTRTTSYGAGFNAVGGGVYAMQWTSDFIRVWFFPRSQIPADIINKAPDPSGWGLPAADLIGTGNNIDAHFVDHAIVFDNTFCGDYAGAPGVWNNTGNPSISCAAMTGYSTCTAFVGAVPAAFKDSYWSINSVRVYQIQDSSSSPSSTSSTSLTPTFTPATSTGAVPTASASLCPTYNFTEVSFGGQTYEIECGFTLNGDDLGHPYPSYPNPQTFEDCVTMCNYWTTHNSTTCIGVAYVLTTNGCYPKDKSYGNQLNSGQYAARLIWAGYGDITDAPPTATTSKTTTPTTTATSNFSTVTPVHYNNPTAAESSIVLSTAQAQSSILGNGMGVSRSSFRPSSVSASSSSLDSSTMPTSSSAFTSTSVLASSSAFSSSSMPMSSSARQSSSTSVSSSVSISSSLAPSVPSLPSSLVALSSSMILSSPGLSPTSIQASSSTASSSSLLPTSTPPPSSLQSSSTPLSSSLSLEVSTSSIPVLPPSSSASPSAISSAMPYTPNSASPSQSTSSSAMPTSSVLSTPALLTPPSSLPFPSQSSALNPISSSSIFIDSTPIPPNSTTPTLTSSSTIAPPANGDATNYVGFSSTSTPPPAPPAPTDEGNAYAGCLSYATGDSAFRQVEVSPAMTIEQCLSDCFEDFYAGVSGQSCYCGTSLDATAGLTRYPESDCNTPCPGDPEETCGGNFASEMSRRRQSLILLTTYNNTVNINAAEPPSSDVPPSSTPMSISSTSSVILPPTMTPSSSSSPFAGLLSSSIMSLSGSGPVISGAPGAGGIPNSIGPVGGSHFFSPGVSPNTPSPIVSSSQTPGSGIPSIPVVISTVWVDVCDVCEHGITTITTTITTLHCGCTDTPAPTIPMTTTSKACAVCGEGGSPATMTITCPDNRAIASASAAASLPATTGTAPTAGSIPSPLSSGFGADSNAEASAVASAGGRSGSGSDLSGSGSGSGSGSSSGPSDRVGPAYGNASIPSNGTANKGTPGGPVGAAPAGSGAPQATAAGDVRETTPARSGDVPLMTNSAATSGSFGAPIVSGTGGITTMNASVAGPTETFMIESKNGAGAVFSGLGGTLYGLLVAALLI